MNWKQIIIPQTNKENLVNGDADTMDIVAEIMAMDAISDRFVNKNNVEALEGESDYDTLKNIWGFVKYNVKYRADRPGSEKVKSPGALFSMGYGDCKSFSIAQAALLRSLGFKYKYRFVAYGINEDYTHVYIVVKLGKRDVFLDAVHDRFDDEVKHARHLDLTPKTKSSGIAGINKAIVWPTVIGVAIAGLIAWTIVTDKKNNGDD